MTPEDLSAALARYQGAMKEFEAIHATIMQRVQKSAMPTPGDLLEEERARLKLVELHRSIWTKAARKRAACGSGPDDNPTIAG
jgi:hypothetical protein